MSLAPGAHVIMTVKFSPVQSGLIHRYVLLRSYATNSSVEYPLSGTGVAITPQTLAATPGNVAFRSAPVGTTKSQSVQLTNTGTQSASVTSATVTGSKFVISGLFTPLSLAAGQTAHFKLQYTPAAACSASGSVTIATAVWLRRS